MGITKPIDCEGELVSAPRLMKTGVLASRAWMLRPVPGWTVERMLYPRLTSWAIIFRPSGFSKAVEGVFSEDVPDNHLS